MKKAKFALAAIAVIGIVGGSLAFKAKSAFNGTTYFTTSAFGLPGTHEIDNVLPTISGTSVYYTTVVNDPAKNYAPLQAAE